MSTDDTTSGDPAHPHETEDILHPTGESNRQRGKTDSRPNRQSAHSARTRAQTGESR